jgi:hypothetical protein
MKEKNNDRKMKALYLQMALTQFCKNILASLYRYPISQLLTKETYQWGVDGADLF